MARIQKTTIIQEDGAARKFVIKQMPATQGFLFGMRAEKTPPAPGARRRKRFNVPVCSFLPRSCRRRTRI